MSDYAPEDDEPVFMGGCFVFVLQECNVSMLFMGGESQRVILSVFSGYSSQAHCTGDPLYLQPNNQPIQKKPAQEVTCQSTTSQPEQHINNAKAKNKKLQTPPTNLCTANGTQQQTNTKQNNTNHARKTPVNPIKCPQRFSET